MSSIEQDMQNAALSYFSADSQVIDLELETLRDKAIFWETRCRTLEKRNEELMQESAGKDTRIEYLERLLSATQEERDNLYSFKNKILSLSSSTDTEEQLLNAKLEIATLRERSDDYEVFIHELNHSIKVFNIQQKDLEIQTLKQELITITVPQIIEPQSNPHKDQKVSKFRKLFRSKKPKSCNKEDVSPSSFLK